MIQQLLAPILSIGGKIVEGKQQKQRIEAQLALAKTDSEHSLQLSQNELSRLSVNDWSKSWKDEFITILITSPLIIAFLGALVPLATFFGLDPTTATALGEQLMASYERMIAPLSNGLVQYDELLLTVVLAIMGVRALK